jgi:hypothetical protein
LSDRNDVSVASAPTSRTCVPQISRFLRPTSSANSRMFRTGAPRRLTASTPRATRAGIAAVSAASSVRSENVAVNKPSFVANDTSWMAASTAAIEGRSEGPPATSPSRTRASGRRLHRRGAALFRRGGVGFGRWAARNQVIFVDRPRGLSFVDCRLYQIARHNLMDRWSKHCSQIAARSRVRVRPYRCPVRLSLDTGGPHIDGSTDFRLAGRSALFVTDGPAPPMALAKPIP